MRAFRSVTASSLLGLSLSLSSGLVATGCVEQSPDVPSEEDVKVARENILSAAPATMKFPVNADLEGKVTYLGMDIDTDKITPGKPFTLTHYWKVNEPVGADWRVFIHLEAPGSHASHLNADHVPIGGKYPVAAWKKGEIIRDVHRVSVPQGWKGSAVELYTGLWKGPLRLKVTSGAHDAENRIKVATIPTDAGGAQPAVASAKRVVATKVPAGTIKIDGKLDEAAWATARSTGAFVKSIDGGPAESKAEAKLLWDDQNLYVAYQVEDKDVWATKTKRDDSVWSEEAVELFVDADGDGKSYVELDVNPKGAVFDSYLPVKRERQDDFDAQAKVAVTVDGTLDKRDDQDKGYTVELALPLASVKGKLAEMKNVPPQVGTVWRVNFFRMDYPQGKPQIGTAWSAPMTGDFHTLEKFGELAFGDDKGQAPAPTPPAVPALVHMNMPGGPPTGHAVIAPPLTTPQLNKASAVPIQLKK